MRTIICSPCVSGSVNVEFAASLAATMRAFPDVDFVRESLVTDVSLARAILLARYMAHEVADALLWIDADESWKPDDVEAVLAPIRDGKAHVVSAVVPMKHPGSAPVYAFRFLDGDVDATWGYRGSWLEHEGRRYARVAHAGTGFLAVSREALIAGMKLAPTFHAFEREQGKLSMLFSSGIVERNARLEYRGEDVGGCWLIRKAGYEIHVAVDANITHWSERIAFRPPAGDFQAYARRKAPKGGP
jgi:hypothetical protein